MSASSKPNHAARPRAKAVAARTRAATPAHGAAGAAAGDGHEVPAVLRRAGLKVTPQRLAIVRALSGDGTHPTAQELFERLRRELPGMSFATVYNTLAALAAAGLCEARAFTVGGKTGGAATRSATRFDPNMDAHDHAVCDSCGAVCDVALPHPAPTARVVAPPGFAVRSVERIYRGECEACRARAAPRARSGGAALGV